MHLKHMWAIFRKDILDAMRDARVLVAVVVPLGLGLLYTVMFQDTSVRPSASIAYYAADATTLPDILRTTAGSTVDLRLSSVPSAEDVRQRVSAKQADLGIVTPPNFDASLQAGATPTLTVIRPDTPGSGATYTLALLDQALRQMAGQHPPAVMHTDVLTLQQTDSAAALAQVGLRGYFVLATIVMLIGMITMLALPIILAEEREKKTLDALLMAVSYREVVVAKACVGVAYVAISIALFMVLTRMMPTNVLPFLGATGLFTISLVGFGLLLGRLFGPNQLNTWGGVFLLPVIIPAFFIAMPLPAGWDNVLLVLPSSQVMRLLMNSFTASPVFPDVWMAYLVIVVWGIAAFAALLWSLSRKEA